MPVQIEISAEPRFYVPLTLEEVEVLKELSSLHYDALCRASGEPVTGGFIHGWWNSLSIQVNYPISDEPTEALRPVKASWRELDLCLKIMEFVPPNLAPEKKAVVAKLTKHFNGALRHATTVLPSWTTTYLGKAL
jgi:hypothetical protein